MIRMAPMTRLFRPMLACAILMPLTLGASAVAQTTRVSAPDRPDDPRFGLLTPLPDRGGLPPIVSLRDGPSEQELASRARARRYEQQLRELQRRHFGRIRVESIRARGITQLREFIDPAAFQPMLEVLMNERDDVRLAVLDHFIEQGDSGQAALAWTAIHHEDDAIRNEAALRMVSPASTEVMRVLDGALRSRYHRVANNAGALAGALNAVRAIPTMMFAQVASDPRGDQEGDLAWIAIQTQQTFVADLQPVVGDSSGAFQPVVGVINEGVVLRVTDAVVIVFRTEVHQALVNMSSRAWGRSTEHLGYDRRAWWRWYNEQFVPHQNERASN